MRNQTESKLQQACVKWFDLQYPHYKLNLFSIPNEGARTPANGARMKAQGRRAGVADMFLAVKKMHIPGIFFEFKAPNGKQSPSQKDFQKSVEQDYMYEIITEFDDFKALIEAYLN